MNIGDATGTQYTWVSKDGFSMETQVQGKCSHCNVYKDFGNPLFYCVAGASLSKWPAAVMISGLVNAGIMSYDDKANKYLDFWAKDPKDVRSQVTLRHLLSFTSGFTKDAEAGFVNILSNFDGLLMLYHLLINYHSGFQQILSRLLFLCCIPIQKF